MQLRELIPDDIKYFGIWWHDSSLIALTSGNTQAVSDNQVQQYFDDMIRQKDALHRMIVVGGFTIGHISLQLQENDWWEIQIVLGDKASWGKGYGSQAIKLMLVLAAHHHIQRVYLEVRPENERAMAAYEKVGFRKVQLIEHADNPNQPQTWRMEILSESQLQ
jgi:RimJ/RimL family protein N-acetyltransferase